jgi:uncharacterized protein YciI
MKLTVLIYTYVEGMLERRAPYRDGHLALADRMLEEGRLLIAGAIGDPPHGAHLVFTGAAAAEEFAAADPYGEAGLISSREIQPWNVVAQRPLEGA